MTDIRLVENLTLSEETMDWVLLANGILDEQEELATAIRLALGTDALADVDEVLPDPDSTDRRGWWGDWQAEEIWGGWPIGCKNWLLSRAKISDKMSIEGDTVDRARHYTEQALQKFLDLRIASGIDVTATRTDLEQIVVSVTVYRGHLADITLRFQMLWKDIGEPPQLEYRS
jgi:phage gp46-like protein